MSEDVAASEIIIVRRRGHGHDDGHGSTAWKIAFADFMTAMMALFLVLWLTNATDLATKKQIATYFNPIELTDIQPLQKGIRAVDGEVIVDKETVNQEPEGRANSSGEDPGTLDGGPEKIARPLFSDPYDAIRRLSEKVEPGGIGLSAETQAKGGGPAIDKGEAFRDPFDPVFRSETLAMANDTISNEPKPKPDPPEPADQADKQHAADVPSAAGSLQHEPQSTSEAVNEEARTFAEELRKAIGGVEASELPNVEVTVVPEGILISLTDKSDFEMFATASAEPETRMSELMAKIGGILKSMDGPIVLRGHTDGRPFRTSDNDNWRLSMARAYTAYNALMLAGVDEKRFDRIEGYADRMLRDGNAPDAAVNRRIEVLLRKGSK
ncbi:MAG: OmpA family protein [Alphaproteobacteria bacterium]|nr:OmpA family protein [Alphaproteobacteria bacterium]